MYSFMYYSIYTVIGAKNFKHERAGFLVSISATNTIAGCLLFISIYFEWIRMMQPVLFAASLGASLWVVYWLHQRFLTRRNVYMAFVKRYEGTTKRRGYFTAWGLIFLIAPWVWVAFSIILPKWLR